MSDARPRDAGNWAPSTPSLRAGETAPGARNRVDGRRVAGPIQGFGRMWQKTYRVRLVRDEITPQTVVRTWKEEFASFWPASNRFHAPLAGVTPGEIGLITGSVGGLRLSTGVLVLYADEESFAFLTPQGHPFAGMITFSAHEEDGATVAQVQLLIRAQDPLTELGMVFGGHRKEDRIWEHTLRALAAHHGLEADPQTQIVCVDKRRQWRNWRNVRHDPALDAVRHPFGGRRRGDRV